MSQARSSTLLMLMDDAPPALPQSLSLPVLAALSFADVPGLSAALRRGDEAAFAWLHEKWGARIGRYCFALAAGDTSFAEEIAQAAWLRLARHIRVLPDEAALWAWTACAARHAATDLRRKGTRYRRMLDRFAEWWSGARTPPAADADTGLLHAMECALRQLSDEERALLDGRYFQRQPLAAIGARHALSERAVEGRLARLRQRLRELIAEQLQQNAHENES